MLFDVFILSVIEGVTEFLPVSSTGHLILMSHWLNMDKAFYEVFDIAIQLGAICAVFFLYPTYFKERLTQFFSKETWVIAVSILPILVVGYALKDVIKVYLFNPEVIFWGLIVGGVGLILLERKYPNLENQDQKSSVTFRQAIIIGMFQCLALWPGMSRSAMTIMGAMVSGLNRVTSAAFSFVIAVPVMVIIVGYDLISSRTSLSLIEYAWIGCGMLISFIIAWITMRWFLSIIQKQGLLMFGIYRIILGTVGLLWLI